MGCFTKISINQMVVQSSRYITFVFDVHYFAALHVGKARIGYRHRVSYKKELGTWNLAKLKFLVLP